MTKKKGFTCPNCGASLRVIRTRNRAAGIVSRRRECPACGRRVTTEERPKGCANGPGH